MYTFSIVGSSSPSSQKAYVRPSKVQRRATKVISPVGQKQPSRLGFSSLEKSLRMNVTPNESNRSHTKD